MQHLRSRPSRKAFLSGALSTFASIGVVKAAPAPRLPRSTVFAGSAKYATARQIQNGRLDIRPLAIAYCESVDDIVQCIRWATRARIPISVRGGGHDYEGFSLCEGGLAIDVSRYRKLSVNEHRPIVRLGAGADVGTMYHALARSKLTLPAGTCHSVGLAGLTAGGGFGLMGRRYGLLCDRLVRVMLVDADGNLRDSSTDRYGEDVLWASQGGGGGNFGVLSDLFYEPIPLPDEVVLYSLTWEWPFAGEILERWMPWAHAQPEEHASICLLSNRPKKNVRMLGQFLGAQSSLSKILMSRFGGFPIKERQVHSLSFIDAADRLGGYRLPHESWKMKSSYLAEPLSRNGIDRALSQIEAAPAFARCILQFDALGGAVGRRAPDATAFPHRTMAYSLQYRSYWQHPTEAEATLSWVRGAFRSLDPLTAMGSYRNYTDLDLPDWQTRYYGANYERLRALKTRLDGGNRFRFAQSIQPS